MRRLRPFSLLAVAALAGSAAAQTSVPPDQILPWGGTLFGWVTRFHREQLIATSYSERFVVFEQNGGSWGVVQFEPAPPGEEQAYDVLEVAPGTLAVGASSGPIHVYGRGPDGVWSFEDSPVPAADALPFGAAVGAGFLVTSHGSAALEQQIETFERGPSGWAPVDAFAWGIDPDVVEVRVSGERLLTRGGRMDGQTSLRTWVRAGSGWHLEAEVAHPDRPAWGEGLSALDGSTLLVEDRFADAYQSRYFVFEYADGAGWQFDAELLPDPPWSSLLDLHLSHDRALLGVGAGVSVYDRNAGVWTNTASLLPPTGVGPVIPSAFATNGPTIAAGFGVLQIDGVVSVYEDLGAAAR